MTCKTCGQDATIRGYCKSCYRRELKAGRLEITPRKPSTQRVKDDLHTLKALRAAGKSDVEIAKLYDVRPELIRAYLLGVPRPPKPWPHGRPGAFITHKCRCDICLPAYRLYKQREHAKRRATNRPVTHGTRTGYDDGCRCSECQDAMISYLRERNARTREKATRTGKTWTELDLEIAARTDISIEEKANLLGRTYAAVDNAMRKHPRLRGIDWRTAAPGTPVPKRGHRLDDY